MKKNIKFGILGLGRVIENRVYKVFKNELKNSKVISVFDKDQKKNSKYSKLFNLKKNKSIKDFLNSNTDYIYIATESGNHAKDIMKCFEANKNVIVEKPPTLRIDQLIKLSLIANKKKLKFYAIYQNRINNVLQTFDGYESYLYYESGSKSWPKSNTNKPYTLFPVTSSEEITWYNFQYTAASYYDEFNNDTHKYI